MGIYMEFCDESKEDSARGSADPNAEQKLKLKSGDGVIFSTGLHILKCSKTLNTMLEDLGLEEVLEEDEEIPLTTLNSAILSRIIDWSEHHKDDPPTGDDEDDDEEAPNAISDWDKEFFNCDVTTLNEIIVAASYLRIKGILDVGCKAVSKMMKNKNQNQITTSFKLTP